MAEILVKVTSWLSLLPRISVGNILEIVIISFLVYELLVWIKSWGHPTRAIRPPWHT